jgi:hypothetical protein
MIRGPIVVMRHAHLIGYVAGRSITTVARRCYSLDEAIAWVVANRERRGGRYWIARAGAPATLAGKFVKVT